MLIVNWHIKIRSGWGGDVRYKVKTKGGRVYKAKTVVVAMGFVTLEVWDGEIRLPAGEIQWVKKTFFTSAITQVEEKVEQPKSANTSGGWVVPVILFVIVFIFSLLLLIA